MAFPADYTLLAKLSTVPAQIAGNETGFVSLITDGSLGAQATNIFANTDNGGGDVRLSSDAAGTIQLPVDVVSWDTTLETCQVWTKRDVDATTAVDVYVWGDNTGDTQPSPATTYGRNFVYTSLNRQQGESNAATDVTGNSTASLTGSPLLTSVAGIPALNFEGNSTRYLEFSGTTENYTGDFSAGAWVNLDSTNPTFAQIIGIRSAQTGSSWEFSVRVSGGNLQLLIGSGSVSSGSSLLVSTDYKIDVTVSGTSVSFYINGLLFNTGTISGTRTNISQTMKVGSYKTGTSAATVDGSIANAYADNSNVKSANYISTEYNNQSAPASFWTASAITAGIDVTPNTVNSNSVAINPTITVNIDTNVSGQVVNTSSISNNPTLQFNTDINVQGVVVNSDSIANNPAINIGSNITVNGQVVNSDSVSNDPTVNITSGVFVVGQVVNTESISNDPSLQFDLSIAGSASNSDSVSLDPSISFGLVVSGQAVNTESVSNNPTLQFNIDISGQTVNTLSNSINPAIQIGEITYSIDTATNIDALSLSININAPILSTNING